MKRLCRNGSNQSITIMQRNRLNVNNLLVCALVLGLSREPQENGAGGKAYKIPLESFQLQHNIWAPPTEPLRIEPSYSARILPSCHSLVGH